MHCFTGSLNFAKKLLTLNAFFSASGIITFKNSTELQNTFKRIDLSKLLVETDSPYLAPIPLRGKKNEPSFLVHTVNKLAEIKKTPVKDIILHTSKNFKDLFQNI
jgi:TatD DNase family protein